MGRIACANVVSDLYAMGVIEIDNILMILCTSTEMTEDEQNVVTPLVIKGFKDAATEAKTRITGGETRVNPWFTIGGVATSICSPSQFIVPENAVVGDVLVLTKPLGTQVAVQVHTWLDQPDRWNKVKDVITREQAQTVYMQAADSMARLNRNGARLMQAHNAHGATDVTGFGILGHANNLAKYQKNNVSFVIHTMPIMANLPAVAQAAGLTNLFKGTSPETSGGLLVIMPKVEVESYCTELKELDGCAVYVVGDVVAGDKTARLDSYVRIIDVPSDNSAPTPDPTVWYQ